MAFSDKEKNNIILVVLASIMASNGLITNSLPGVICSMLVSPYLSAIKNIAVDISKLTFVGHNYLVLGTYIGLSFLVGMVYYLIQRNFLGIDQSEIIREKSEMLNRADLNIKEYVSIFIYALACGFAIGFITNNTYFTEVTRTVISVGISIGVALLPTVVNSGLFIIENNRKFAFFSIMNTFTNIIGIIIGILMYIQYFGNNIKK